MSKNLTKKSEQHHVDTLDINPIYEKYRNIDEIKNYLEVIEEARNSGDIDKTSTLEFFNYPKGKKIQLTVEVEDPELFNVIVGSEWGDNGLMPAMKIVDIRWSDLEGEGIVANWLRERLSELEEKGL